MLGPHGLARASLLVGSWLATSAVMIGALAMVVGGTFETLGILPTASTGVLSPLLDGLAAVALLTVAGWALIQHQDDPAQGEGGLRRLLELPLPLLLALSCGWQLLSPEDGLLYARALNQIKQSGIDGIEYLGAIALLWLSSSSLMVVPLVILVAVGRTLVDRWIVPLSRGLEVHGRWLMALLSLSLAGYLGWQSWFSWQAIGSGTDGLGL
jgi:hypothetical protein